MELVRYNIPEIEVVAIKFNGEYIQVPTAYNEVILEGLANELVVKLYSHVNDGEMHVLASFDIYETDDIDTSELLGRESCFDIYEYFDVDEAIEQFLEPCRI